LSKAANQKQSRDLVLRQSESDNQLIGGLIKDVQLNINLNIVQEKKNDKKNRDYIPIKLNLEPKHSKSIATKQQNNRESIECIQ
jgi:hypothetical protein